MSQENLLYFVLRSSYLKLLQYGEFSFVKTIDFLIETITKNSVNLHLLRWNNIMGRDVGSIDRGCRQHFKARGESKLPMHEVNEKNHSTKKVDR